jgi:hypothetical protein
MAISQKTAGSRLSKSSGSSCNQNNVFHIPDLPFLFIHDQ